MTSEKKAQNRYNKEDMSENIQIFNSIAVLVNPTMPEARIEGEKVAAELEKKYSLKATLSTIDNEVIRRRISMEEFDLMIVLGGDGSMLRCGHLAAPVSLPLLGINLGRFGFLMQLSRDEWPGYLERLMEGDFKIERRMMLKAEHWRDQVLLKTSQVVNEVVVCRGQYVRPIRIRAAVDGYTLASYVADGLIAATPTGSTAYALATNGPILPPELRNILIVPVAPHLSMNHAVVLPEGATVEFTPFFDHQAVMSVDGHPPEIMANADRVRISASEYSLRFIAFQDPGYFYRNLNRYMEQNPSRSGMK